MNFYKTYFTPNEKVSARSAWFIIAAWFTVFLAYWTSTKPLVLPSPFDIVAALPGLWTTNGLGQEMIGSLLTSLEGLGLAILFAFPLAYLSRVPAFVPLADGFAILRFLSPAVFYVLLLFVLNSAHDVKVTMLALGEGFFLARTMIGVVRNIPEIRYDDARTLRMSEWQSVWYVNIRGTVAEAIDAIRDNAAMGWAMLMMVEGIVRSEGGVGVLMLNQEKHVNFAEVYAIAAVILTVGIAQDYILGAFKKSLCPYARVS